MRNHWVHYVDVYEILRLWLYDVWDVISAATVFYYDDLRIFWINDEVAPQTYVIICWIII